MRQEFRATANDHGRRLETVVRKLLPRLGLAPLHRSMRRGDIRLNGKKATPETKVCEGDTVEIWDALLGGSDVGAKPENRRSLGGLPFEESWILFQSEDFLVINKPSGLLVQGDKSGEQSLDDLVKIRLATGMEPSLSFRPGPLHRLDRPTSGIVVFSASLRGARKFTQAMVDGEVYKVYWALLQGELSRTLAVESPLTRDEVRKLTFVDPEGRASHTQFVPLAHAGGLTLTEVRIATGRTHQIRAHARQAGFPLAGDSKYSARPWPRSAPRPWFLHARRLECGLLPPLEAAVDLATVQYLASSLKVFFPHTDE